MRSEVHFFISLLLSILQAVATVVVRSLDSHVEIRILRLLCRWGRGSSSGRVAAGHHVIINE